MKQTVVQLLLRSQEHLLDNLSQQYRLFVPGANADADEDDSSESELSGIPQLMEFVQSIFELHLDIYARITNPSSQVEREVRVKQADSLERWASLADDFMRIYSNSAEQGGTGDTLVIRFLWASTIYAGKAEDVEQHHMVSCLEDLKHLLQRLRVTPISLPNNAAMPQISIPAAEHENPAPQHT